MLWREEPARAGHGGGPRSSAHGRDLSGASEQPTSAGPEASSCGFRLPGCPEAAIFAPVWGSMQGSTVDSTGGALTLAPLWVCSSWSKGEGHLSVPSVFGDIYCPANKEGEGIGSRCYLVTPCGPPSSERLGSLSKITQPHETTG